MTDLQARIGPRIFPNRSWIRPGYQPPKSSKHDSQHEVELEPLKILGAAGGPRDCGDESEIRIAVNEISADIIQNDERTRVIFDRSKQHFTPQPQSSRKTSVSLLQRMGVLSTFPNSTNSLQEPSYISEKSLVKRMESPTNSVAFASDVSSPSLVQDTSFVSDRRPQDVADIAQATEAPFMAIRDNRTSQAQLTEPNESLIVDALDDSSAHSMTSLSPFSAQGENPLESPSQQDVPPSDGSQRGDDWLNTFRGRKRLRAGCDGFDLSDDASASASREASLTPFSSIGNYGSKTSSPHLNHLKPSVPDLHAPFLRKDFPTTFQSPTPPADLNMDNILFSLTQKNALGRSNVSPGTPSTTSVDRKVLTRDDIESFSGRVPAVTEELELLRYTPSPERRQRRSSPQDAGGSSCPAIIPHTQESKDSQHFTRSYNLRSRESQYPNHTRRRTRRSKRRSGDKDDGLETHDAGDKGLRRRSASPGQSLSPHLKYHSPRRGDWQNLSPTRSRFDKNHQRPVSYDGHEPFRGRPQDSHSHSKTRGRRAVRPSSRDSNEPRRVSSGLSRERGRPRWNNPRYNQPRSPFSDVRRPETPPQEQPRSVLESFRPDDVAPREEDSMDMDMALDLNSVDLPALQSVSEPHTVLPCHNVPGLWFARQGLAELGISTATFEIDDVTATAWNIPSDGKADQAKNQKSNIALLLCCYDRKSFEKNVQALGAEMTSGDLVNAILMMQILWPPEGHLIISVNAEQPEGSVFLPHTIIPSQFLRLEQLVHQGANTIEFIQLSDMSSFIFVLLAQEHIETRGSLADAVPEQLAA